MRRLLIEQIHGLGDIVCFLPLLRQLRTVYSDYEISIVVKTKSAGQLIEISNIKIEHIYVVDMYSSVMETLRVLRNLRKKEYDILVSSIMTPVNKANIFMRIIKPKEWIGLQKFKYNFDFFDEKKHFVDAYLELISKVKHKDICFNDKKPRLYPPMSMLNTFKNKMSLDKYDKNKIIGICVGDADFTYKHKYLRCGKIYARGWGIDNVIELIKLFNQTGYCLILFGGKSEINKAKMIKGNLNFKSVVYDYVNKTNIIESAALAKLCFCVIGVDTGMQHISAAVGTHTISIFGPTNPKTHGAYSKKSVFVENSSRLCKYQYCYGTNKYIACDNRICLTSIKPQNVYNEYIKLIEKER